MVLVRANSEVRLDGHVIGLLIPEDLTRELPLQHQLFKRELDERLVRDALALTGHAARLGRRSSDPAPGARCHEGSTTVAAALGRALEAPARSPRCLTTRHERLLAVRPRCRVPLLVAC